MKIKYNSISNEEYVPDRSSLTFQYNGNNSKLIYTEQYFDVSNPEELIKNTSNTIKHLMELLKNMGQISDYNLDIHKINNNGVLARMSLIGKGENLLVTMISEFSYQLYGVSGYETLENYFEIIKFGIKTKWKDVMDKITAPTDKNCRHEIVKYNYSIQDNTFNPPTIIREFYEFYHLKGVTINGKSLCAVRLKPILSVDEWYDSAGWCYCDNPEPLNDVDEVS